MKTRLDKKIDFGIYKHISKKAGMLSCRQKSFKTINILKQCMGIVGTLRPDNLNTQQ